MIKTDQTKLKRLIYQSTHRGCKETDFLLGKFATAHLKSFSNEELETYEKFISEDDWDIYAWLTGELPFPLEHDNEVTTKLRKFNNSISA